MVILGLGIGMSVVMFAVFRAVLLRRRPVTDQDRIAVLWTYRQPGVELTAGTTVMATISRQARTMRGIAGVAHFAATGSPWLDGTRPVTLNRSLVTGTFFQVLGVRAVDRGGGARRVSAGPASDAHRPGRGSSRRLKPREWRFDLGNATIHG